MSKTIFIVVSLVMIVWYIIGSTGMPEMSAVSI